MKKSWVMFLLIAFMGMGVGISPSHASEVDVLLQKLVEKGVLTAGEAQEIKVETQEQVKKDTAEGKNTSLPQWVQNTKLKGDFRLRYQKDHMKRLEPAGSTPNKEGDQDRARLRLRVGLESKVNEQLLVGFGIATGHNATSATTDAARADSARSTNWTLGDGFGKEPIALDYAFAQYTATSWLTVIGGKFKNPLWEPGDLIWDTDINPAGVAFKMNKQINPDVNLFVNTGVLTVENSKSYSADTAMYVVQPGVVVKVNDSTSVKGAFSYYGFTGEQGKKLDGTAGTNTNATINGTANALVYGYENITPALEVSFKDPFKAIGLDVPYFAPFVEYVWNIDSSVPRNDSGYMYGFKLGQEKVEKFGDWQFRYNYAVLEKDAILDILPDSDRYGGKTGMKSHEAMLDFGLGPNTWLGLDYYYGWQIPGNFASSRSIPASVYQVDWNMKF